MKLHLPSGLRKALLVCLAAVALPTASIPTTIASASGIAAAFLATSQRTMAMTDDHNWGQQQDAKNNDAGEVNLAEEDKDYKLSEKGKTYVFQKGGDDVDIKLSSGTAAATDDVTISLDGAFNEVWITGAARFKLGSFNKEIGKLYVGEAAQLWLQNATYTDLTTELHLGATTWTHTWPNNYQFKNAALVLEASTLTTSGNLVLEEDAKIAFDTTGGNSVLTVAGIQGDHTLTLGGNGKIAVSGGGSLGALAATEGNVTVEIGDDKELTISGELSASATGGIKLSGGTFTVNGETNVEGSLTLADSTNLTLNGGGAVGGAFVFGQTAVPNTNKSFSLKLGASFKAKQGISGGAWDSSSPNTGTMYTILSEESSAIDFIIGEDQTLGEVLLWGGLTMGSEQNKINLVKKGSHHQGISQGDVKIYGDVKVEEGVLRFTTSNDAHIYGSLSGAGQLYIVDAKVTVEGSDNDIGGIRFSNENKDNVLTLKDDIVVGQINFCNYQRATNDADDGKGTIKLADGVTDKTVYVLMSKVGEAGSASWDDFYAQYKTDKGLTLDDGIGIGVKVAGSETKTFTNGGAVTKAFKVTGRGTLKLEGTGVYDFQGGLTLDGCTLELAGATDGFFKVGGSWTWTDGTVLKISGSKGLTIDLTGLSSLNDGIVLTLDLSQEFLSSLDGASGEYQLFKLGSGGLTGLDQYFALSQPAWESFKKLRLTSDGKLKWDVFDNPLVWYTAGEENTWTEKGAGWGDNGGISWVNDGSRTAKFTAETGEEVMVSGKVQAAAVEVAQGEGWEFNVTRGNSLTVINSITVSSGTIKLSGDGKVSTKNVTLTGGSLELDNTDLYFSGSITGSEGQLTGTGYAFYTGGGSMDWSTFTGKFGSVLGSTVGYGAAEKELTITGAVDLSKSFKAADGTIVNLNGDVTFNGGKLVLGDGANIVLGGTLTEKSGEVSVTHKGTENGEGTLTVKISDEASTFSGAGMTFGERVILLIDTTEVPWGTASDLKVDGKLKLTGGEVILSGENTIENLDTSGLASKFTLNNSHTKTTLQSDTDINVEVDMRAGELTIGTGSDDSSTTLTLKGGLRHYTATDGLKITGANLTFAGSFAEHTWSGGLDLKKLTMNGGSQTFTGAANGVTLTVDSLEVTGGSLTMGSTGKGMTIETGGINITGGKFKWAGAVLTVTGDIIVSGGTFELAYGEGLKLAWDGAIINDPITLYLTGFTEDAVSPGGYGLFESEWQTVWADKITVKGATDTNKQLTLDAATGKVIIKAEDGSDGLYWPGTGESNALVWGTGGDDQWALEADKEPSVGWTTEKKVYLGAGDTATVTLKDPTITAASITFTAANAEGGYTFTSGAAGGSTTLLIQGNMTNHPEGAAGNAVKAVFDEKVTVHVKGNFISTGAKGDFTFKRKLQVDGLLQLWNSSVLQLDEGGVVDTLDASWNNVEIKLGGDLEVGNWFFEGGDIGGHYASFARTGDKEVFIDVGRVVNGNAGQQSQAGTLEETTLTRGNIYRGLLNFGEGVGIRKSSGTLTFGGTEDFEVGGSYAAVGGGNMVFNVNASAGMNVEIGTGSSITVGDGKRLGADGSLKGTGGELILGKGAEAEFTGGVAAGASFKQLTLKENAALTFVGGVAAGVRFERLTLGESATLDAGEVGALNIGTLDLGASSKVSFTVGEGATTLTLTQLTLAQGATLEAGGASKLDIGKLTLAGDATIKLSGEDEGMIKLGSGIGGGHVLTIALTGFLDSDFDDWHETGYQLFDPGMDRTLLAGLQELFGEKLTVDLGENWTYDVTLDENGRLIFSDKLDTRTHTGTGGGFVWNEKSATWDERKAFAGANAVIFTGAQNNTVTLTIPGETRVKEMTVQTTDGGVYTFASDEGGLSVERELLLGTGAVFQVDTTVEKTGTLTGRGALTVDGKTFTLLSTTKKHDWIGELTVQNGGVFSMVGTLKNAASALVVGTGGGTVDLDGAEAVLPVGGNIVGEGNALTLTGGKLDDEGNSHFGKLDWTGSEGALGSARIEKYGEFAIGGTLTMGGNIVLLGGSAKLSGSGTIQKGGSVENVYVQFQADDDEVTSQGWFTDRLGGVKFGAGVGLQKTGKGKLVFDGTSGTLDKALEIVEGSLSLKGEDYTLNGELTGAGEFIVATEDSGKTVTLNGGANMTGDLALSCYAAKLSLGANATFGGLINDGDNFWYLSTNNRKHIIENSGDNVTLTLNVTSGDKEAQGVNIGAGVKVVKDGDKTQKFKEAENSENGRVTLAGGLEVKAGTLEIEGAHSTISGVLSGTGGTLRLVGDESVLTISGGGTYGGTLEIAAGTIIVGKKDLTVGTFKATGGTTLRVGSGLEDDLKGDLIIDTVAKGSALTTLEIDSGRKVRLGEGTLKATTLDLIGTTGAGFVIDMTGQAKLDFDHIELGEDKLVINLVGYNDEPEYQLFKSATFGNVWKELVTQEHKKWTDIFEIAVSDGEGHKLDKELLLDRTGLLTILEPDGMLWTGGDDGTWADDSHARSWKDGKVLPRGKDVRFTAEYSSVNNGEVKIDGLVTPKDVYVVSGEYTFTGDGGGLNMSRDADDEGGVLQVGGRVDDPAKLTLKLENTKIPEIQLGEKGTLVLAHDKALPMGSTIKFRGGTLEYSGEKLTSPNFDVSTRVADVDGGSSDVVKVSVDGATYGSEGVTWGSVEATTNKNSGLRLALDEKGIAKSGTGSFTLEWTDDGTTPHGGSIAVTEGGLQYKVHADTGITATLSGTANVVEGDETSGGVLTLTVDGAGTLEYKGTLTGGGGVSLGESKDSTGGTIKMSGDSSAFTGLIGIQGDVEVGNDKALGGAKTKILFNGGNLSGSDVTVNAGEVTVEADATLSGVTLAGTVIGDQDLTAGDGTTAGLSGDISQYNGGLNTGTSGTWKLSGKALEQTVTNAVSGDGTVEFAGSVTYGGEISGGVTLKNSGKKKDVLLITGSTTSEDVKLDTGSGKIVLGDSKKSVNWSGKTISGSAGGEVVLSNVTLSDGGFTNCKGATLSVETAKAPSYGQPGGVVDLGGMNVSTDAIPLSRIVVNERGQLKGVGGTITVGGDRGTTVDVYLASMNVGDKGLAAIVGDEENELVFDVKNPDSLKLYVGASAAGAIAESFQDNGGEAILHVVENGSIGKTGEKVDKYLVVNDEAQAVLEVAGAKIEASEGDVLITGSVDHVYIVRDEMTLEGDGANVLGESRATLLSRERSKLHLSQEGTADNKDDDITVNNLVGVNGSELTVENTADSPETDRFTVHFNNTKQDITQKDVEGDGEKEDVEGQDTSFYGSITAGAGVDVEKEGLGTFTVGGNYTLEDGDTTITAGRLVLQGEENSMEDLVFNYTGEPGKGKQGNTTKKEERGLVLADGGTTTVNGSITESTDETGGKSDAIEIQDDSKLVLKGESDLKHASITGDGSGTVKLEEGASLTLSGEAKDAEGKPNTQLSGVGVTLAENSTLDVGKGENDVTKLEGDGLLKSAGGGKLTVGGDAEKSGGSFSGTLGSSDGGKAGTLAVADGVDFTLDNANSTEDEAWDVKLGKGANLTVDVSEKSPTDPSDKLTLGDVDLGDGTMTVDFGEKPVNGNALEANIAGVGKSGTLDFHSDGNVPDGEKVETGITVADGLRKTFPDHVKFTGAGNFLKDREVSVNPNGKLMVTTKEAKENKFEQALRELPDNVSKNALAGATMMWDSLKEKSQLQAFFDALSKKESDYDKLAFQLISMFDNGQNAELESTLEAVAGSSISTLGPALAEDLHRQLKAIRNRTTTMAGDVSYDSYDNLPIWHAWINGEGGYHKLDSDGGAPGYTLNNWGGTVGVDVDVTPQTTMGLAITAMYGDLKPSAADGATGNLDTTYLSAFLRATSGAWIHTFVVSGGLADVQLDRTVNYGAGSYRTQGSTDGYAVGAMYEVGYTRLVNKEGTVALQPVFNVEVRHASIKGYNETGTNAGLSVDDIGQDVMTFGMGARMQSIVGENAFNRTSIFEARLLVKADAGDRSGTAMNGIVGSATRAEVESAEVGAVGVEAGMGITIPLGSSSGSIFMDASVEWRKGWTSVDAAAGYRVNF